MRGHARLPKHHSHDLLGKGLADLPGQSQRFKVQMQTRCHLPCNVASLDQPPCPLTQGT